MYLFPLEKGEEEEEEYFYSQVIVMRKLIQTPKCLIHLFMHGVQIDFLIHLQKTMLSEQDRSLANVTVFPCRTRVHN